MSKRYGPVFAKRDYAGFWRRTAALAIDAALLWAAWLGASYGWYFCAPAEWVSRRSYHLITTIWWLFAVAYLFGMRLTPRGTLGYRLVGIRYAYMLREQPTRWSLAFRAALAPLLLWFFALDHLWILADKRRQAWHDKVTGYYVVRNQAHPTGTVQMVQRTINFMQLTFIVWEPAEDNPAAVAPPACAG